MRLTKPAVQWVFGTLVLFAAGAATALLAPDSREKALLEVHHYACRRMWPEVLAAARRCPDSAYATNAVNRALYHTGRLGAEMCRYVQQPDALLITGDDHSMLYWHAFDTLMDLGLANLAEKNLTECLETFGEHPLILERLATVNLAKGRTDAARIYLGALRKTLFHHRWASDLLARLDADPNLAGDAEMQRLRAQSLRKDSIAEFYAKEAMLTALAGQGSGNRMAFEYLTSWHLLHGQLGKFVQQMERLDEFGYREIPPLWQEAILIYTYGTGKPLDLHGRTIGPEMHQRFKHFSSIATSRGNDRAAAIPELAKNYAGSYLLLLLLHQGGEPMNRTQSTSPEDPGGSGGVAGRYGVPCRLRFFHDGSIDVCRAACPDPAGLCGDGHPAEYRSAEFRGPGEGDRVSRHDPGRAGRSHRDHEPLACHRDPRETLAQAACRESGRELAVEVLVRAAEGWRRFDAFPMTVANEDIDGYLAYRRIHPAHSAWRDMGIYQRDLRTFEESPILTNDYFRGGCVNCHTFCNNRTDTMLVSTQERRLRQFRRDHSGRQGGEGRARRSGTPPGIRTERSWPLPA